MAHPGRHLQLAATSGSGLAGFLLARTARGEYGRFGAAGVLESVGVDPASRHAGVGRRMLAALEDRLRARGVGSLVTQADWRNAQMLRFLDACRFRLAPRHVLSRAV